MLPCKSFLIFNNFLVFGRAKAASFQILSQVIIALWNLLMSRTGQVIVSACCFIIFPLQIKLQFPEKGLVYDYQLDDAGITRKRRPGDIDDEEDAKTTSNEVRTLCAVVSNVRKIILSTACNVFTFKIIVSIILFHQCEHQWLWSLQSFVLDRAPRVSCCVDHCHFE